MDTLTIPTSSVETIASDAARISHDENHLKIYGFRNEGFFLLGKFVSY